MEALVQRLAALECRSSSCSNIEKDLRVIMMQIGRAEDKVLRMARGSSWTRSDLLLAPPTDRL